MAANVKSIRERMDELAKTKGRVSTTPPPINPLDPTSGRATKPPIDAMKTKEEGQALITALQPSCNTLQVVDEESYLAADAILGKIQRARKAWNLKMYGTAENPGPIPNIRKGLDQLYALNSEIDKPLEKMELAVKGSMRSYKLAEQRRIEEENRARREEEERLQREAEAKARAAEEAKTAKMRERLQQQAEAIRVQAAEASMAPVSTAVQGVSSETRKAKKPTITNWTEFFIGLAEGTIPADCIEVKVGTLNRYYKNDPETTSQWPGITIVDDIVISGR